MTIFYWVCGSVSCGGLDPASEEEVRDRVSSADYEECHADAWAAMEQRAMQDEMDEVYEDDFGNVQRY